MKYLVLSILFLGGLGCTSTREFWRYIVNKDVTKPIPERPEGTEDRPRVLSPHNVKVVYSDGSTSTEVLIPILASGQQIVLDHHSSIKPQALSLAPLPPTPADRELEDQYVKSGNKVVQNSSPVSIIKTHEKIRELVRDGQYGLALEYCDQLLKRYPSHVKTLRTKGSLLLKIGELKGALDTYRKAQAIEFDGRVEEQVKSIENSLNKSSN